MGSKERWSVSLWVINPDASRSPATYSVEKLTVNRRDESSKREAETRDGESQAVFQSLVSLVSKPVMSMPFMKFVYMNQHALFSGTEGKA